jgi:hypothetical protein
MTNITGSKLSIFSHSGKITVFGLLQDHFHIEAHMDPFWHCVILADSMDLCLSLLVYFLITPECVPNP